MLSNAINVNTLCSNAVVSDFKMGGWGVLDGNGDFTFDGNGDLVFDVAPSLATRFTSSVVRIGNNIVYTYRIDSYTDFDLDFTIPECRTSTYPGGWTGTVEANDYAVTTHTDTGLSDVYGQRSQAEYVYEHESPFIAFEFGHPVSLYVPAAHRGYHGTNTITSIQVDEPNHCNTINFTLSGAPAAGAEVLRRNGSTVRVVATIDTALLINTSYHVEDEAYEIGENTYSVKTGSLSNCYVSGGEAVVND